MNKKLDQNGAVAIITVVIFSIIISVLITAYLRSAVVQQQESLNYDFSNRAFYSAESGVQDTIRAIKVNGANLTDKDSCDPFSGSDSDFSAESFGLSYNCQLLTIAPSDITGSVQPNKKSAMIKLEPSDPVSILSPKLVMRWSLQVQSAGSPTIFYPREDGSKLFSPTSKWLLNDNQATPLHPPLKVAVIDHPVSAGFQRSDINQRVVFMNPTDQANKQGDVNFTKPDDIAVQQDELLNNAECYVSDSASIPSSMKSYSCKQTIDLAGYSFTSSTIYVRVGSIYRATDFSLELLNGGTPVALNNSQVIIDITGKSGDSTYRRIKQAVPLGNYQVQYGPDAAIVAGEGICKQFGLGTDPSVFERNAGCDPLSSNLD